MKGGRKKMTTIKCIKCGKARNLDKESEKKILAKHKNDIELVKKEYICRDCKKKDKTKK